VTEDAHGRADAGARRARVHVQSADDATRLSLLEQRPPLRVLFPAVPAGELPRAGRAGCWSTSPPMASSPRSSSRSARGPRPGDPLVEQDLDFADEMADDPIDMDRGRVVVACTRLLVGEPVVDRHSTVRSESLWI
jgi:hypothetical protein